MFFAIISVFVFQAEVTLFFKSLPFMIKQRHFDNHPPPNRILIVLTASCIASVKLRVTIHFIIHLAFINFSKYKIKLPFFIVWTCVICHLIVVLLVGHKNLVDTAGIHDTMYILSNFLGSFYLPLITGILICSFQYFRSNVFRYYAKFTYFNFHSAFFATAFLPIMFFRPRSWKNALIPAFGLRLIKRLFGFRWKVTGHENIVQNSGAVVLINHQSILDLIVLAEMWPIMDHCTVISKKEIFYLGPFGLASYLWGTIFIDRLNPDKAKDTINRTGEIVKKRKAKLLMFPEGTRHGGDKLLPFKKGAFHVAISSKVPIQPVVVSKYYYIDFKEKRFDSGFTQIEILPPISTENYSRENIDELVEKTYQIMSKRYEELNKEIIPKVENGKCDCNKNTNNFSNSPKRETENNHAGTLEESDANLRHLNSRAQLQ